MGKFNHDKIYTSLGAVVSEFTYGEFIYFMYNFGMDYYDDIAAITKDEWQDILTALKGNYTQYEVEKKINYRQFRENMATFLNDKFRKHPQAHNVMITALVSFDHGNKNSKLKYLIRDFDEHEAMAREFEQQ